MRLRNCRVTKNDDINDAHWFNYLNELAKEPDGVIISSNLAKALGLKSW